MTIQQEQTGAVPQWDVADRLRKSLRESHVGVQEMAEYLGVKRNTVSNWINGRIRPSKQSLRLWALRTGIPLGWIEDGNEPPYFDGDRPTTPCYAGATVLIGQFTRANADDTFQVEAGAA